MRVILSIQPATNPDTNRPTWALHQDAGSSARSSSYGTFPQVKRDLRDTLGARLSEGHTVEAKVYTAQGVLEEHAVYSDNTVERYVKAPIGSDLGRRCRILPDTDKTKQAFKDATKRPPKAKPERKPTSRRAGKKLPDGWEYVIHDDDVPDDVVEVPMTPKLRAFLRSIGVPVNADTAVYKVLEGGEVAAGTLLVPDETGTGYVQGAPTAYPADVLVPSEPARKGRATPAAKKPTETKPAAKKPAAKKPTETKPAARKPSSPPRSRPSAAAAAGAPAAEMSQVQQDQLFSSMKAGIRAAFADL